MEVKRECEQIHNGLRQANKFTIGPTVGIWSRNNICQSRRGGRVEKGIDETKWLAVVFRQAEIIQQSENRSYSLFFFFAGYQIIGINEKRRENLRDS